MKKLTKWLCGAFLIGLFSVFLGSPVAQAREMESGEFTGKFVSFRTITTDSPKVIELDRFDLKTIGLYEFDNRDTQKWAMVYAAPYQAYTISHLSLLGHGYLGEVMQPTMNNGAVQLLPTIGYDGHWRLISAGEYNGQQAYYIENMLSGRVITHFGAGNQALFTSNWKGTENQKFFVQVEEY